MATKAERTVPFDHHAGRRVITAFLEGVNVDTLNWAWGVVVDTLDAIGHHTTPQDGNRREYIAQAWLDWYGSFLFEMDAQHTVHGLAREFRDACPPELASALQRTVEAAFRACDTRSLEKRVADRLDRLARQRAEREAAEAPDPRRAAFTVLEGGRP
jgi:hypothetical protein